MPKIRYQKRLKILHVTTELTPLAKAGGLGDIVGYLPKALAETYPVDIRIVMAKYETIDLEKYCAELIIKDMKVKMPDNKKWVKISVWKTCLPDTYIPVYLIECPKSIYPNGVVLNDIGETYDEIPYFLYVFISKVAIQLLKAFDWHPDVIHYHDGFESLMSKWIRTIYKDDPFLRDISSVETIHNLATQPIGKINVAKKLGLKRKDFRPTNKLLKKNEINLTAEAIMNADMINTVSVTYAKEILTKKYGAGLQKLLQVNKDHFTGILNGMDYHDFDPRTNEDTPVKYWIESLDKKVENKLFLQKKLGLTQSADLPLVCVVSRLTGQKGLDLIEDVLKDLLDMGGQFIVLGSGWKNIEKVFIKAEKKHPEEIAAEKFDTNFAQTIYAGADMILMPSRFEPCGLSQIIAMRFGTIPIVRKTGGLADTVRDGKTGFVFKNYEKKDFLKAIGRAVETYYNQKEHWRKMQINCMKKDFSWKKSAKKYIWLYKKAIKNHKEYLKKLEQKNE
ncbi:MAG: glycogen/starch synthase [Patescibacteria group bacterium]|jgi:starch synthase